MLPAIEAVLGRAGLPVEGFDGTASELQAKLAEVCSAIEQKARWYPVTASQLGSALRRLAPVLKSRGIEFLPYKAGDKNHSRMIVLRLGSRV